MGLARAGAFSPGMPPSRTPSGPGSARSGSPTTRDAVRAARSSRFRHGRESVRVTADRRHPLTTPHRTRQPGHGVVCRGAKVVDGDDVRVGEAAGDCGFAGEPGHLPAATRVTGEHLDRHQAVDLGIVCCPDLSEPARTDRLDQPVAPVQHGPFLHDSPLSARTDTHGYQACTRHATPGQPPVTREVLTVFRLRWWSAVQSADRRLAPRLPEPHALAEPGAGRRPRWPRPGGGARHESLRSGRARRPGPRPVRGTRGWWTRTGTGPGRGLRAPQRR